MVKTGKNLGGRPRQSQAGLREQVGVRFSPEMRELLKREAWRSGHSVTKEIEIRLATSLSVGRQPHIGALMAAVGKLAAALERQFQKRWIDDAFTTQALTAGIEQLLFHFGRFEKPKLPPKVKKALTEKPPEEQERLSTPKGWGEFQAGLLISLIEGAQKPIPRLTPEGGYTGWGYWELRKALGSGWKRNRAAWGLERFSETQGGAS